MRKPPEVYGKPREKAIRRAIKKYIDAYELKHDIQPTGISNLILIREGWPPRDECTPDQLVNLWVHIHQRFPL